MELQDALSRADSNNFINVAKEDVKRNDFELITMQKPIAELRFLIHRPEIGRCACPKQHGALVRKIIVPKAMWR